MGGSDVGVLKNASIRHFACCCLFLEDLAHVSRMPALGRNILNGTDRANSEIFLDFLFSLRAGAGAEQVI